jgi:peptidoglycan/xylan/chitin deacetylase (PgdA/CDA1 family)
LRADYEGALDAKKNYAVVTFDDGFVSVMENALPELQKRKMPATIFVPSGYLGQQPGWIKNGKKEWVMSSEQLRAARRGGLTIGSHTVRHVRLDNLPLEEAVSEMAVSKQELEKILEEPVNTFSFPHGAFTPAVLDRAMKIGYTRVFGIEPARLTGQMNDFLVHRVAVNPSDWSLEFRLKVRGAYRWLEKKSK